MILSENGPGQPVPRNSEQMLAARPALRSFYRAGYRMFPLRIASKIPRDVGWRTNAYSAADLSGWFRRGGNIGIVLSDVDLVLDIDPRHDGSDSLARLEADLGVDLSSAPTVLSGRSDGGRHLYFKKPAELRVRKIAGYPGIDVKTVGGLVVAPGSRHPDTGGVYRADPAAPPISEIGTAPKALLQALRGLDRHVSARASGGGELTVEQLEMCLAVLDPRHYGQDRYDRWIAFAAAAHDATNGDGLEVWLHWAGRDDNYGLDAEERNVAAWNSFKAGRPGGSTYLTILSAVASAGRYDLVKQIEPNLDFDEPAVRDLDFTLSPPTIDEELFDTAARGEDR